MTCATGDVLKDEVVHLHSEILILRKALTHMCMRVTTLEKGPDMQPSKGIITQSDVQIVIDGYIVERTHIPGTMVWEHSVWQKTSGKRELCSEIRYIAKKRYGRVGTLCYECDGEDCRPGCNRSVMFANDQHKIATNLIRRCFPGIDEHTIDDIAGKIITSERALPYSTATLTMFNKATAS